MSGTWAPAVDIYEQNGNLVLQAEVPGLDPKDVDVRVENNVLTLRGERKLEQNVNKDNYHRVERSYGSFSRSLTLPFAVDPDKAKATFKNGVLSISLPKPPEVQAKAKKIAISTR